MSGKDVVEEIMSAVPAILRKSMKEKPTAMPKGNKVKGHDFNEAFDYSELFSSYKTFGLQATNLALAIDQINQMIKWRLSDEPVVPDDEVTLPAERKQIRCTIFLGYTSNLVSSGVRSAVCYLCQHKMVDCVVTTAGGVEEDLMQCVGESFVGGEDVGGGELLRGGVGRCGNILTPKGNYERLKEWLLPIIDAMYKEEKEGAYYTPSDIIDRLGKEIGDKRSIYYWCNMNKIPVFCPGLTDGVIGDALYLYSFKHADFVIDILADLKKLNKIVFAAKKTGAIILGGGVIKHHICNANLMRNGADYSVYINTGIEYDASDAGATPDEAVSWGKIKSEAKPVKVYAEASLVFPIIVAETFLKHKDLASKLNP